MLEQNALEAPPGDSASPQVEPSQSQPVAAAADTIDVGELYLEHRNLLMFVAARKFRIPEGEAENLIQEVFLSFLQVSSKIDNIRGWLVAAVCNASRHYWRAQGRTETLPDDIGERSDPGSSGIADRMAQKLTVQQSLSYLTPRCQQTLHLHYFEGRSAADVARELGTTSRYAEKMIHNCLKRVREIYLQINRVNR